MTTEISGFYAICIFEYTVSTNNFKRLGMCHWNTCLGIKTKNVLFGSSIDIYNIFWMHISITLLNHFIISAGPLFLHQISLPIFTSFFVPLWSLSMSQWILLVLLLQTLVQTIYPRMCYYQLSIFLKKITPSSLASIKYQIFRKVR